MLTDKEIGEKIKKIRKEIYAGRISGTAFNWR